VRHVGGIEGLAAERLAGLAGLDPGAARHRAGIDGLAVDRTAGNGPGAAAQPAARNRVTCLPASAIEVSPAAPVTKLGGALAMDAGRISDLRRARRSDTDFVTGKTNSRSQSKVPMTAPAMATEVSCPALQRRVILG